MRNISFYFTGWMPATGDGGEIYDYLIRTINSTAGIGTYNAGYYSNYEIDRIGEEITYTMDSEERLNLMQQGFEIAMNDVACIPLLSPRGLHAAADYIDWMPSLNTNIKVENIGFK
jgi:ABC-type transport system substrate-binding protein